MASFFRTTFDNLVNNINTTLNQHSNSPGATRAQQQQRNQARRPTAGGTNRNDSSSGGAGGGTRRDIPTSNRHQQQQAASNRSSSQQPSSRNDCNNHHHHQQQHRSPYNTRHTSNSNQQTNVNGNTTNMGSNVHQQNAASALAEKQLDITDVRDLQDINQLSAKQLKIILTRNCIDYKGVFEKEVLREKVMQLWIDCNEKRGSSKATNTTGSHDDSDDIDESQACKICMEREINCVLLECGHMLTCVTCGRKLAECPVCRQNVSRCVRTFRG